MRGGVMRLKTWIVAALGLASLVLLIALSMLASDRLSGGIRGAMCGYGVFSASAWGFRALVVTVLVAVLAGVLAIVLSSVTLPLFVAVSV